MAKLFEGECSRLKRNAINEPSSEREREVPIAVLLEFILERGKAWVSSHEQGRLVAGNGKITVCPAGV